MTALNRNQPKLANHLYILTTWTTPTTCVDARSTSTSRTTQEMQSYHNSYSFKDAVPTTNNYVTFLRIHNKN